MTSVSGQVWSVAGTLVKQQTSKDLNFIKVGVFRGGDASLAAPDSNSGGIK